MEVHLVLSVLHTFNHYCFHKDIIYLSKMNSFEVHNLIFFLVIVYLQGSFYDLLPLCQLFFPLLLCLPKHVTLLSGTHILSYKTLPQPEHFLYILLLFHCTN